MALLLMMAIPAWAADASDPSAEEFFETEVRPLLVERCQKCHGDDQPKGGLRLTSRAGLLEGGDSGPAAVAGQPEESLLVQAVRYQDEPRMPPKGKLAGREIETLTRWVAIGLPWPEAKEPAATQGKSYRITEEQRRFWSFQPVRPVAPPEVRDVAWPRTDIDRFILAALEARGMRPAPAADKKTLLRRATFDLTGLPPSPAEIDAFLADDGPAAFARVVDRLLASPRYGERWGRHWLDLVRYADSRDARDTGGPADITEAWRYRDWVVAAFNGDLPYDRFVRDQIAGDLVPGPGPDGFNAEGIVATGLLAIGEWGTGDADKEKMLTDIVDDQVDVVGRVFLGLTIACARCHDHKFDPIPTADYYALAGIFFSTHILPEPGAKTAGSPLLRTPLVPPAAVTAAHRHTARIAELEAQLKKTTTDAARAAAADRLQAELATLKGSAPPPIPLALAAQEGGVPKSAHAGIGDARIHVRGSYRRLGERVPRRFPRVLAGDDQPPIAQGSGRLELARWIARADNPLVARVLVNRVWQYHFGEGLVRTPSNFGRLGEPPTHPELLGHLAARFVSSGWSIKALHRAILLSAVYQQESRATAEAVQLDPENRLLGRMGRRRLEAEAIRDSLLAVSGRLEATMGGPSVRDLAGGRRTLYVTTIRSDRSSFGPLFDAADPTAIVDRRTSSTVAPQALFLLNHPLVLEQARALARRITGGGPADDRTRIASAYVLLYGRPPTAEEVAIGRDVLARGRAAGSDAWEVYCQVLLCANEFLSID